MIFNFARGVKVLPICLNVVIVFLWILVVSSAEKPSPTTATQEIKGDNCTYCNTSSLTCPCLNTTEEKEDIPGTSECDDGFYGINCSLACPKNCVDQVCNKVTGDCEKDCIAGYRGNQCREECDGGLYGTNCSLVCPKNCVDQVCDGVTGECEKGCVTGYQGNLCSEDSRTTLQCDDGFYGTNCSLVCPKDCSDQVCDGETGDCEKGCIPGYQGNQCSEVCSKGYYGDGCKNPCPVNCVSEECHYQNGYCLKGCKEDFWGSDCTLHGEFKDNPEPVQQKFYSQLSDGLLRGGYIWKNLRCKEGRSSNPLTFCNLL